MLASHQGSGTPPGCDGDEDVTMDGWCHACEPHTQRERFGIATIADKLRETRLRWVTSFTELVQITVRVCGQMCAPLCTKRTLISFF
ncbi:hypothetical protein ANCDUO_24332 [Ancylostoma duodenale]|uniref:Uncharacterized protein n=1 Tax=Ancylostoma duodenale TaxID=51022 RepID=A0A0C2C7J4_9BILA|nr:hypothetical protein ANCDUO_24332 [Ancylostoma duodenale]